MHSAAMSKWSQVPSFAVYPRHSFVLGLSKFMQPGIRPTSQLSNNWLIIQFIIIILTLRICHSKGRGKTVLNLKKARTMLLKLIHRKINIQVSFYTEFFPSLHSIHFPSLSSLINEAFILGLDFNVFTF